jgi:hypothetical protein
MVGRAVPARRVLQPGFWNQDNAFLLAMLRRARSYAPYLVQSGFGNKMMRRYLPRAARTGVRALPQLFVVRR